MAEISGEALSISATIAVIGAGTMGAGIALVAARAGHNVLLHDSDPTAIERGVAGLRKSLDGLVDKGRMTAEDRDAQLARIAPASDLAALAPAALVVEAIVENLEIKGSVFQKLEAIVAPDAILATNTSSLSVTAIAARLSRPARFVGMHFFNPATILPLVEVVSGYLTSPDVAARIHSTARAWGKSPVHCRSTPGFIVNRVARPFYGEALRLLSEGAADCATIDAILRESGGFRMGAFELMDLIGHDVNFAVTRTVYESFFHDPRYKPSLAQKELVDAGLFGRKSGRGFYDYAPGVAKAPPANCAPGLRPARIVIEGDLGPASALADLAAAAGIAVDRRDGDGLIRLGAFAFALTDGRCATERFAANNDVAGVFDLALEYANATRIAIALADQASPEAEAAFAGFLQALGKSVSRIDDAPGLVVMRTVAMLANEAADALHQQVASAADIDQSMLKGVNYPRGPLAWADAVGAGRIASVIAELSRFYGDDRYRASPRLRRVAASGGTFYPKGM